ncbi:MAG: VOC family protein [Pararhodobacter sp.]
MLGDVAVGARDLEAVRRFHDAVLGAPGDVRLVSDAREIGRGAPGSACRPSVNLPFDGRAASVGNGSMPCFQASSRAGVAACHAAGLAEGRADEGVRASRPCVPHVYVASLRDADGNTRSEVCETPPAKGC